MEGDKMCRFILGILFVVMVSHPIQAWYHQREYRDEYTSDKVFIRVLANLTQVPDDIPDEATEVNLRYNRIRYIPINAFSNLRVCWSLRLTFNKISVIESGSFNGLNSLTELYLIKNEISVIESGMFNELNSVRNLYLQYNMITDIAINAFSNLGECRLLRLDYNKISVIESGSFNGLNSLTGLYLNNNEISVIESGMFNELNSVRNLYLQYNMITSIPINAFSNLRDCHTLRLEHNKISVIESGMFNGLNSLTELHLWNNKISVIESGSFNGLNSLTGLYLGYNMISAISEGTFTGLSLDRLTLGSNKITALVSLKNLLLNNNGISTLPANAFSTLSNCNILILAQNPIKNIEARAFNGLDKLIELNLLQTSLTHLSQNVFKGLPSLQDLRLDQGRISEIVRGAFAGLDQLPHLTLHQNELTVIESYMFSGLLSLDYLFLNHNNITDIMDFAFLSLGNLTRLYLFNNQLEHLSMNTFAGLVSLEFLDIGDNKLITLDPLVLSPLPRPLELAMDVHLTPSSMVCDIKLCWLKMEEEAGSIVWNYLKPTYHSARATGVYYPSCTGGDDWRRLQCPATLPCSDPGQVYFADRLGSFLPFNNNSQPELGLPYSTGSELTYTCQSGYIGGGTITCQSNGQWTRKPECVPIENIPCRDPGQVEFAKRSGSFLPFNNNSQPGLDLPYSSDYELRYTCDPCYTGGGIITCQSNGQWTRKPECVRIENRVVCRAPVLVDGYLTPSVDQYECGVRVTFTCNQGSTQTVGVCGPDGQFIGGISSCERNGEMVTETEGTGTETPTDSLTTDSPDQGTKTESVATGGGSSGLIYGIVGAVGAIVVTAIICLTIFCIIRLKKRNPSEADMVKTSNTAAGDEASEAGYTGLVTVDLKGKPGNSLNRQAEPTADRNTPEQRVAGDGTVYSNTAYEDEYQEIKDALPKEDPYEDVDEDAYEN